MWLDTVSTAAVNFTPNQMRMSNVTPSAAEIINRLAADEPGFRHFYIWFRPANGKSFADAEAQLAYQLEKHGLVSKVVVSGDRSVAVARSTEQAGRDAFVDAVRGHFAKERYITDYSDDGGIDQFLGTYRR
ncbi:MAG TPA: hypothetical protein VD907_06000 [Verrucomicrobiae bacterium]|nr:hypothetical protein [Verrucomicrobiae bacterium]